MFSGYLSGIWPKSLWCDRLGTRCHSVTHSSLGAIVCGQRRGVWACLSCLDQAGCPSCSLRAPLLQTVPSLILEGFSRSRVPLPESGDERSDWPDHPVSCRQVMWLFNRQRPLVRKMAPGFQQTSGSKEAIASLRRGHIQKLNLRYTQVSHQELRCLPCAT